jgi:hypothetical protein
LSIYCKSADAAKIIFHPYCKEHFAHSYPRLSSDLTLLKKTATIIPLVFKTPIRSLVKLPPNRRSFRSCGAIQALLRNDENRNFNVPLSSGLRYFQIQT